MPLTRLIIKNYKSIKNCDISLEKLNVLIGENGSGKTTILDAIKMMEQLLFGGRNYRPQNKSKRMLA